MDIYTATQRLTRTFTVDSEPLSSSMYGAIGDGYTCALVGINGSVDWLCLPRFDSPSVFGGILDLENGGFFQIAPAEPGHEALQSYDDSTNVLQTLFSKSGHALKFSADLQLFYRSCGIVVTAVGRNGYALS